MLMKLWHGYWNNKLEIMNMKVDKNNSKYEGMVNGQYRKVWRFSSNEFSKNFGCLVSDNTFGLGGLRL